MNAPAKPRRSKTRQHWRPQTAPAKDGIVRALPHRPEAENAVLGGIMLRGPEALVEVLDLITVDDLYQPRAQAVLRAMQIVHERGDRIDVITVEDQLRRTGELELVGGIEGLARLDRYATAHNIESHAKIIRELAVRRRLVVYHREQAEQLMSDDEDDLGEYVATSQAQHAEIASQAHGDDSLIPIRAAVLEGFRELKERISGKSGATPFGFRKIDKVLGGMLPGEFWLLGARTGNGKSAFGWAVARNQVEQTTGKRGRWQGRHDARPVFFSSNEMSATAIAMRGVSEAAMIDGSAFRRPTRAWLDAYGDSLRDGAKLVGATPITFGYRRGGYPIDHACADCRLWARRERAAGREPVLGVFDYLQNYGVPGWLLRESRIEQIAYISKKLVALAAELRIPILALMQLNRGPENRPEGEPEMMDLRESGAPEMAADGIGLLWRPERYHPDAANRKLRLASYDQRIASNQWGSATQQERDEYDELYRARLHAKIKFPKVRGAEPDWTFALEFLPEYTRFLDPLHESES